MSDFLLLFVVPVVFLGASWGNGLKIEGLNNLAKGTAGAEAICGRVEAAVAAYGI